MKRKFAWLVVSCLMVAALLLASCAPAVVEEKKVTPPVKEKEVAPPVKEKEVVVPGKEVVPEGFVKWRGVKRDGTVVEKMIEKPRYGGIHVTSDPVPPGGFDYTFVTISTFWGNDPVNETIFDRAWDKGPGGTREWSGQFNFIPRKGQEGWTLAEGWELPDDSTIIFHIRQGVRYGLDPTSEASRLVGGREFTAADVVFQLKRQWQIGGYSHGAYPFLATMAKPEDSFYVSPTDKWAVVVKTQPNLQAGIYEHLVGATAFVPPEVIQKYGNMKDWRNVVGTGSFFLRDYVSASSLTYVRNPNYCGYDPFFPENQLPYLDGLKVIILSDLSTQMAALRTGKIDRLLDVIADNAASLMKTNPELEWVADPRGASKISMRNDTKPFDDIRVRRALNMGVNKLAILELYYGGKGQLFAYPVPLEAGFEDMYMPFEQTPESVKELYTYNPDKARQLLKEAGYPQGFQTEVLTEVRNVDLLSIVKEDWAKIGVDLKIELKEPGALKAAMDRKLYTQMTMSYGGSGLASAWRTFTEEPFSAYNYGMVNDPRMDEIRRKITAAFFDDTEWAKQVKDSIIYRNEQAWYVMLPSPNAYIFWQPWLKAYYGVKALSHSRKLGYTKYVWLDQELKKAMGR